MNVVKFAGLSKILTAFVVLALLAAAAIALLPGNDQKYVTVDFRRTVSLYEGSDVKVLGVPVGTVETVRPKGDVVRVKIVYDGKYKLPKNVEAAIISPSVVGDRFVQMAPAYDGGAALDNNAKLNVERTHVPLELDEIFKSLDDLSVALGPEGANEDGALSRLVDATAEQFDGQGAKLNETITNFAKLSTTLSNNKEELFGSVDEIEQFVSLLKANDQTVRSFNDSTAEVASVLEGERDDLAGVLKNLSLALVDVKGFVKENRKALRGNVDGLTDISKVLAKNVDSIEESTRSAPAALTNLGFTYNEKFATLDTRLDIEKLLGGLVNVRKLVCSVLGKAICTDDVVKLLDKVPTLEDLLDQLGGLSSPPAAPGSGEVPEIPGAGNLKLPRSAAGNAVVPGAARSQDSLKDMLAVR